MSLWDTVKGPPPDLKGKTSFTPYSGFTLGTPVFTHYPTAGQGIAPCGTEYWQYHLKGKQDEKKVFIQHSSICVFLVSTKSIRKREIINPN